MSFPIVITIPAHHLKAFRFSEFASWEDYDERGEKHDDYVVHVYEILKRYSTKILINNEEELHQVYCALCHGTFQISPRLSDFCSDKGYKDQLRHYRYAPRLADRLRKHIVDDEIRGYYPEGV